MNLLLPLMRAIVKMIVLMPYRLPADRIFLNPPTFRKVFSTCAPFPCRLHLAVGRPRRPTQRFPKHSPKRFPSVSKALSEEK